jgi:hypothetical protein
MKIARIAVGLLLPIGLAFAQKAPDNSASGKAAQAQSPSTQPVTVGELKTYKGELVDASCAAGGATATASSAKSPSQSAADRSSASAGKSAAKTGEASRTGEGGQSCAATSSTNAFGLRTKDGNTLRFDEVGNERAKETIAARKKWSDAIAAGKPVQVAISAAESADRLTVVSIH